MKERVFRPVAPHQSSSEVCCNPPRKVRMAGKSHPLRPEEWRLPGRDRRSGSRKSERSTTKSLKTQKKQ